MGIVRNQVMVDEATDFSPVQLACMGALASPGIQSFFARGDFNQRITAWGSRSTDEMRWAFPQIEVRPIHVSYRHSRQLNHLASEIVRLCSGETVDVALPKDVDNEGVAPVLGTGLTQREDIVSWLGQRFVEIERFTKPLPSVAVLVNDEVEVGPLADGLKAALADENLNVVACYKGQFAGQENDIRVFDVQHIKGLEFEAVFFVGVDTLAAMKPDLFDKYLYVGTTRAATYLGLTCTGAGLPQKIEPLRDSFGADWKQ
jgi:DNA helicase IV